MANQEDKKFEWEGFEILPSQVTSAMRLFEKHPEIATQLRATTYFKSVFLDLLLCLVTTLCQPSEEIHRDDLSFVESAIVLLKDTAGLKLDWLQKALKQVYEKKNKEAWMKEMEEQLQQFKEQELSGMTLNMEALTLNGKEELYNIKDPLSFDDIV